MIQVRDDTLRFGSRDLGSSVSGRERARVPLRLSPEGASIVLD
jgi:hypothetical protein